MKYIRQYSSLTALMTDKTLKEYTGKAIVVSPEGFNLMGVNAGFFSYNVVAGVVETFEYSYFFDPTATKYSNWKYAWDCN